MTINIYILSQPILLTAAKEDTEEILSLLQGENILHTPLEVYVPRTGDAAISDTLNSLNDFENIVYSSIRNARFFLQQVEKYDKKEAVQGRLNLAVDEATFQYLESHNIPAIHPPNGRKPIDVVEMMLRLQRLSTTLYPCGAHQREDFPGFLEELDIPVTELDVFDLEGPAKADLMDYRDQLSNISPDSIIFHSRRSVNRTLAAFSDLVYENAQIISADKGISNKLKDEGIRVDAEAEGSWKSVAELV